MIKTGYKTGIEKDSVVVEFLVKCSLQYKISTAIPVSVPGRVTDFHRLDCTHTGRTMKTAAFDFSKAAVRGAVIFLLVRRLFLLPSQGRH